MIKNRPKTRLHIEFGYGRHFTFPFTISAPSFDVRVGIPLDASQHTRLDLDGENILDRKVTNNRQLICLRYNVRVGHPSRCPLQHAWTSVGGENILDGQLTKQLITQWAWRYLKAICVLDASFGNHRQPLVPSHVAMDLENFKVQLTSSLDPLI